jgi:hypothetical protein
MANLSKPIILRLRKHNDCLSRKYRAIQQENREAVLLQTLQKILPHLKLDLTFIHRFITRTIETSEIAERISDLLEGIENYLLSLPHFTSQERENIREEATKQMGEFALISLKCYTNPSDCRLWRKWLSRNPIQHLYALMSSMNSPSAERRLTSKHTKHILQVDACTVICFSKNRYIVQYNFISLQHSRNRSLLSLNIQTLSPNDYLII